MSGTELRGTPEDGSTLRRGSLPRRALLVLLVLLVLLSGLVLAGGEALVQVGSGRTTAALLVTLAAVGIAWRSGGGGWGRPPLEEAGWVRAILLAAGLSLAAYVYVVPEAEVAAVVVWFVVLPAGAGRLGLMDTAAVGLAVALAFLGASVLSAGAVTLPAGAFVKPGLVLGGSVLGGLILSDLRAEREELLRNRAMLANEATVDLLTGLPNRRAFEVRLDEEVSRAERYRESFTVAMLDLDGFKEVNDRFGHSVGDDLLARTGELIARYARDVDLVSRYGGDEFALLLPNTIPGQAWDAVERIRMAVERNRFRPAALLAESDDELSVPIAVTLSVGIAGYPPDGTTADELMKAADRGMYRAKSNGRNRVDTAPSDPGETLRTDGGGENRNDADPLRRGAPNVRPETEMGERRGG